MFRQSKTIVKKSLIDCPFPDCDRKGDNGFNNRAGLASHVRAFHAETRAPENKVPEPGVPAVKPKKYKQRKQISTAPFATKISGVNFCPACGTSLAKYMLLTAEGMSLSPEELNSVLKVVSEVVSRAKDIKKGK